MKQGISLGRRSAAMGIAVALLLAACGGSDDRGGSTNGNGGDDGIETPSASRDAEVGYVDRSADLEGEPVEGGTLVVAPYVFASALDPARTSDSGVAYGELALFYDALARFDYESGEYEPWLAKSIEADDAYETWTVELREGITFSDGTPLDSAAVKLHLERTQQLRPGYVTDGITVETPDDLTIVYHLPEAWAGFPYVLATNPGRIVSPAAVEEHGDDIVANPVGTGPFVLKSWDAGEELVAERNPDYWNGTPHLDAVKYVSIKGQQAVVDAMKGRDVHLTFLREPLVVDAMRDEGYRGFLNVFSSGQILLINNGVHSDDTPGADVRVRQAIARAIDIELFGQDASEGKGLWTKGVLGLNPHLDTTVEGVGYDPDEARRLLEEAKADGYDGKIELTCHTSPESDRRAIATQSQLNAVGFDVSLDMVPSPADTIRKYQQEGTFELACYGPSFQGEVPYVGLMNMFGPGNTLGYEDPEMEELLAAFRLADSREAMSEAADRLQERINETQPIVPLTSNQEFIVWRDEVHGIDVTSFSQLDFSEAWLTE